jgi:enamine deaminase RidA (YjgF/YER057c/UK114 family)
VERAQAAAVVADAAVTMAAAGSSKELIVSATIYLADIGTFADMNKSWEAWVHPVAKPARATLQALLVAPEYRVEIQVTALVAG